MNLQKAEESFLLDMKETPGFFFTMK